MLSLGFTSIPCFLYTESNVRVLMNERPPNAVFDHTRWRVKQVHRQAVAAALATCSEALWWSYYSTQWAAHADRCCSCKFLNSRAKLMFRDLAIKHQQLRNSCAVSESTQASRMCLKWFFLLAFSKAYNKKHRHAVQTGPCTCFEFFF